MRKKDAKKLDEFASVPGGAMRLNELLTFFGHDTHVAASGGHNGDHYEFHLSMTDYLKAVALRMLLPEVYEDTDFDVEVKIFAVVGDEKVEIAAPSCKQELMNYNVLLAALSSNELVQEVRKTINIDWNTETNFVIFKKDGLIQFPAEAADDYMGNENELPEDLARKLFPASGASWCTAV